MKNIFVIILLSLFLINFSHAENILNFYGLDFVIPKKLKGKVIKLEDYEKSTGTEFNNEDLDFFGFGTGEATIGKNSKAVYMAKSKILNAFFDGNFEKNMEKLMATECKYVRTEKECLKKFLRLFSPSFFILASDKFDSADDEYSESDLIKEAMMDEFNVEDLADLEEVLLEDNFGSLKMNNTEIFIDQNKNPILFVSIDVNVKQFGKWDTYWYIFTYDNRLFFINGDCAIGNRCKSVRKEMNLLISKFINIDNSQKINTDNGKILINAVGGLKKAYQIRRMYKFLLILL